MANVQFEDPYGSINRRQTGQRGLTGMLMKWGLVSNAKQANVVLVIIMVVAIVASIMVYPRTPELQAPEDIEFFSDIPGAQQ